MLLCEKRAFLDGASVIIGLDEAGRGPLAGPVVAAAVVLKAFPLKRFNLPRFNERIDDSKKLLPRQREKAFSEISRKTIFGLGLKNHRFIDKRNIRIATLSAMKQAVERLVEEFCRLNRRREKQIRKKVCVLVDGNMSPELPYKTVTILKGDSKSLSIAAASIVAKVTRDRIMVSYDKTFPQYGFSKHKGYGTKSHIDALKKHGPCAIHRKSFAPVKKK